MFHHAPIIHTLSSDFHSLKRLLYLLLHLLCNPLLESFTGIHLAFLAQQARFEFESRQRSRVRLLLSIISLRQAHIATRIVDHPLVPHGLLEQFPLDECTEVHLVIFIRLISIVRCRVDSLFV